MSILNKTANFSENRSYHHWNTAI